MSSTHEQFDCPVPWCCGNIWEHGGDGLSGPENWLHSSEAVPLSETLRAVLTRAGSGPASWHVYVTGPDQAVSVDAPDAEQVALTLEDAARRLRAVAQQLGTPALGC